MITNSKALSKVYWNWACILAVLAACEGKKKSNCKYFSNQFRFLNSKSYSLLGCTITPFSRSQKTPTLMSQPKFSVYTYSTKASKIKQRICFLSFLKNLTLPGIKPFAYTGRRLFKYSFKKTTTKPTNTLVRQNRQLLPTLIKGWADLN